MPGVHARIRSGIALWLSAAWFFVLMIPVGIIMTENQDNDSQMVTCTGCDNAVYLKSILIVFRCSYSESSQKTDDFS